MAFFLQLHLLLISLLFFAWIFGNQASLTNCNGTLIWLADSTASAPPVRKNKGSFQRVSFLIIHMSQVILSFNFRDISLKSQETFVYFSVMFHLLFSGFLFYLTFFVELSFKLSNSYSFIYSYLYIRYLFGYNYSFIHPYTYWFSSLFLSC